MRMIFVFIATSVNDLQELVERVRLASLVINVLKTKVMVLCKIKENVSITVNEEALEQFPSFVYLGAIFTEDGSCTPYLRKRLAMCH